MLDGYFENFLSNYRNYKSGSWCYEDGIIYRGLQMMYQSTGNELWLSHLIRLIDDQISIDGALTGYHISDYNIDNIQTGRVLYFLHEKTGEERYIKAANVLAKQLRSQPRTRSNVYWHKLRYPWQIWLDGLYMAAPFQIAYAQANNKPELIKDSINQISTALKIMHDPKTGLYIHAYDEAHLQPWSNKENGWSKAYWSRAIGWLAMCLVDVAELVTQEEFAPLKKPAEELLATLLKYQQPNGLWLQVIDRPDLSDNYEESSASAMFVYALVKGARLGLVDVNIAELVDFLVSKTVKNKNGSGDLGGMEMVNMCEVAGLGPYEGRYRDGSAEYYLTEPKVSDDSKGVAPLMMAIAEKIRVEN